MVSTAAEVQGDVVGATGSTLSIAPSTGVKRRKKRKSIGQQSTSRAKAAQSRSPLKPARQPRKRVPKPDLAEPTGVTELDGSLAKGLQEGPLVDAVSLDVNESAGLPQVAEPLDSRNENVEPSVKELQEETTQKPKKRKRVPVEELPKKRVKSSSTQSKRAPKALKTHEEIIHAGDALDAVQSMEEPAEVDTAFLGTINEEQEAAPEVAKPRKAKPRKRKRVTVGQQPKKRAKAGTIQAIRRPKAQEESSAAGAPEASQNTGKSAEVEADSMGHLAQEQEAIAEEAEEAEPQTQKPKRKKRKSIGQQKPKKKSIDPTTQERTASKAATSGRLATRVEPNNKPTAKRGRPKAKTPLEEPQAESLGHTPEEDRTSQPPEPGLKSKPIARRGRPKAKTVPEDAVDEPDEAALRHAPAEEGEPQAPVLPEKKKRGRPRKADAAQPTSQTTRPTNLPAPRKPKTKPAAPKPRAPPKNSIPITIYAPPSPTSSAAEDDPLTTSHPHPTTNTINAVDVLSQLCSELLSKSSSALADQARSDPSPSHQSELERTKQTTDLYAKELAARLLQLTTTLNANTSLQSRVRAAAKEERSLKKELKALEKEREDVRVRKEVVMKEKKKRELEDLLSGIAGAVKRGWEMQKEGEEGDAVAGTVEEVDLEV